MENGQLVKTASETDIISEPHEICFTVKGLPNNKINIRQNRHILAIGTKYVLTQAQVENKCIDLLSLKGVCHEICDLYFT